MAKKKKGSKVSCHTSKSAATKKRKEINASGYTAQVSEEGGKFCVYKGRKRKKR